MKWANSSAGPFEQAGELDVERLLGDDRWHPLVDLLPDAITLVDRLGLVQHMNVAAESLNEISRGAMIGRPIRDFVKASRIDCASLTEGFERGKKLQEVIEDADGRAYLLQTRPVHTWEGELNCYVIIQRSLEQLAEVLNGDGRPSASFLPQAAAGGDVSRSLSVGGGELVLGTHLTSLLECGKRAIALGSRLLILGESGVGKTELARMLHRQSGMEGRPFVHVNCGSIPESLFESEMFGYERGAFTGATSKGKKGLIEVADGGTLFLDEVGEIPLQSQAKILQVLEGGGLQRVGSTQLRKLRIQVIAATNRDLAEMVKEGTFRRDLYYRLCVVPLKLAPLRERREIIGPLLDSFLERINQRRTPALRIDAECRRRIMRHDYPGNIRELQNLVEHLAVLCDVVAHKDDLPFVDEGEREETVVQGQSFTPPAATTGGVAGASLKDAVRQFEQRLIEDAVRRTGSKRKAAEELGVDIATIVRKSR